MKDIFHVLKWKSNLNIEDIIKSLREMKLLPSRLICPSCKSDMVIHKDSSRKDHFRWVCKRCRKRKPIRINTWASRYRIPFDMLYLLLRFYVEDIPINLAAARLKLFPDVVAPFFADLDALQPIFAHKMQEILKKELISQNFNDLLLSCKNNFRKLSRLFVLSSVFNIVLQTLHETSYEKRHNL
ncbi:hypothetical protein GINT2_001547 [Glugoides intestinalis]